MSLRRSSLFGLNHEPGVLGSALAMAGQVVLCILGLALTFLEQTKILLTALLDWGRESATVRTAITAYWPDYRRALAPSDAGTTPAIALVGIALIACAFVALLMRLAQRPSLPDAEPQ